MIQEITTALTLAKQLRDFQGQIKDAEFKMFLADLQVALADAKVRVASLEEENLRLRQQIAASKQKSDIRAQLDFREGVYFLKDPEPGRPAGPYCPACLDSREKLQILTTLSGEWKFFGKWECPVCEKQFGPSNAGPDEIDFA